MSKSQIFEQYAVEYDRWFDKHKDEFDLELNAIRKLLPDSGTGIEIGAGTGRFTQALAISLGVEPSAAMRKIAMQRGVHIINGLAESLPVNNNSYDYALLVTAVCFLDSLDVAFKELHRILKDNGSVIIALIDKTTAVGKKYAKNKSKFYQDATFYSVGEVQEELEKAGFHHFEIERALLPEDAKTGQGDGSFVVLRGKREID